MAKTTQPTVSQTGTSLPLLKIGIGVGVSVAVVLVVIIFKEFTTTQEPPVPMAEDELWSNDNLMTKGRQVYFSHCAACHGFDGLGLDDLGPALADSKIVNGGSAAHIYIVLNGKEGDKMVMPANRDVLSDGEIAAVITYQRNSWGNDGGVIQPNTIAAAR